MILVKGFYAGPQFTQLAHNLINFTAMTNGRGLNRWSDGCLAIDSGMSG